MTNLKMEFKDKIVTSIYHWEESDYQYINDSHTTILAWGLDRESNPIVLRFEEFPVQCYLELPTVVNKRSYRWTQSSALQLVKMLSKQLQMADNKVLS